MSDPNPNLEGTVPTGSPTSNETRLEAPNSQIGNAALIVSSPGAVLNQVHVEQGSSAVTGILAGILGVLLLLLASVLPLLGKFVPSGLAIALVGVSSWMIVGGFFSWVESLLNVSTKSDIAGWLVGVEVGKKIEPWPETFAKLFDRVFGAKHLSWKCFWRSCMASLVSYMICVLLSNAFLYNLSLFSTVVFLPLVLLSLLPDYISLLKTRRLIGVLGRHQKALFHLIVLLFDLVVGCLLAVFLPMTVEIVIFLVFGEKHSNVDVGISWVPENWAPENALAAAFGLGFLSVILPNVASSLFTSIWLWLYAGSGFVLKAARRFDIGFQWFNAKFDIEKKPLQSIGLVAGSLVAVVYWALVIVSRFMGT